MSLERPSKAHRKLKAKRSSSGSSPLAAGGLFDFSESSHAFTVSRPLI